MLEDNKTECVSLNNLLCDSLTTEHVRRIEVYTNSYNRNCSAYCIYQWISICLWCRHYQDILHEEILIWNGNRDDDIIYGSIIIVSSCKTVDVHLSWWLNNAHKFMYFFQKWFIMCWGLNIDLSTSGIAQWAEQRSMWGYTTVPWMEFS